MPVIDRKLKIIKNIFIKMLVDLYYSTSNTNKHQKGEQTLYIRSPKPINYTSRDKLKIAVCLIARKLLMQQNNVLPLKMSLNFIVLYLKIIIGININVRMSIHTVCTCTYLCEGRSAPYLLVYTYNKQQDGYYY